MSLPKQKTINLLTVCRRAGRLTTGFDEVKEGIGKGKVLLVICASDLSPKSEKEIRFFADKKGTKIITCEAVMDDFQAALGKHTGIIGICDEGFAKQFAKLSEQTQ